MVVFKTSGCGILKRAISRKASRGFGLEPPRTRSEAARQATGTRHASESIAVVGSVNVDIVLSLDRMPSAGETISARQMARFPGGKGANQAAAAAMLGAEVDMVGQIGKDSPGEFMRDKLLAAGVNVQSSLVHLENVETGSAVVMVLPNGENSIIIVGGANTVPIQWTPQQCEVVSSATVLLMQREISDDTNTFAAQLAARDGTTVVLDAGGADGPLASETLSALSVLSPNETELARMTNMPTETVDQVLFAARTLLNQGVESVLVKLGSRGSMLIAEGGDLVIQQSACPVEKVVDTTGAGDCFTAAYAVACMRNMSPKCALRFAAAAAAICIQRQGAMSSMPTAAEVDAQLQAWSEIDGVLVQ